MHARHRLEASKGKHKALQKANDATALAILTVILVKSSKKHVVLLFAGEVHREAEESRRGLFLGT